jgi:hypothetical protein
LFARLIAPSRAIPTVLVAAAIAALHFASASASVSPASKPAAVPLAIASLPTLAHQAYLKGPFANPYKYFGSSVDVSDDTVVVGAPGNDSNRGAAYVFVRDVTGWTWQATLTASNAEVNDDFGASVAIDGDTVVVGAIFEAGDGSSPSNNDLNTAGAVYVFTRSGTAWSQQAYLKASNPGLGDRFGEQVAISGDTIAVGVPLEDSDGDQSNNNAADSGAVYVFKRSGTAWSQDAYLKAGNIGTTDDFGRAVGVDGDTLVVGAHQEDGSATTINGPYDDGRFNAGAAYVYVRSGSTWSQQAYLKSANPDEFDEFGWGVAVSGDTVAVGVSREDSNATGINGDASNDMGQDSGAVYVFTRSGTTWSQQAYVKSSNSDPNDAFGRLMDLDGDTLAVSSPGESSRVSGIDGDQSDNSLSGSGASYVFQRNGGSWSQTAYVKATNPDDSDYFTNVAVNGGTIVVGAPFEDSSSNVVNGDQADDSHNGSGAAYVIGTPCLTGPFNDVPTSHTFCKEIEWMKQAGISAGFLDGGYHPATSVTRQAMSAFLARLANATLPTCDTQPFTDISTTHAFCREIKWMKDEAISTGFGDGTYRPNLAVSRQAMASFMAKLANGPSWVPTPCSTPPFPDVPITNQFCPQITWVKDNGISTGFGDGTYRPTDNVTRQAMSAFMYRLNGVIH